MADEALSSFIPPSSIKSRVVNGSNCAAAKVVPGLVPDVIKDMVVGLTCKIGVEGTGLEDVTFWLEGPVKEVKIDASGLYPTIDKSIKMHVAVEPESIAFQSNINKTDWLDGHEAVTKGWITFMGDEEAVGDDMNTMQGLPFAYRWCISTINNIRKARVVLQMVPCTVEALDEATDPYSADMSVSSVYSVNVNWASLPLPSWGMPGGMPAFRDARSQKAKDEEIFPSSWIIKSFVYKFLKNCPRNPELEENEAAGLIINPTAPPSIVVGSNIIAAWPDLQREAGSGIEKPPGAESNLPKSSHNMQSTFAQETQTGKETMHF